MLCYNDRRTGLIVSKDPAAASTNHHLGMLESTMILQNLQPHVPVIMEYHPRTLKSSTI